MEKKYNDHEYEHDLMIDHEHDLLSYKTLLSITKVAINALVILIVAIPEGLPLTVSIAMALSINQLKYDNILINLG